MIWPRVENRIGRICHTKLGNNLSITKPQRLRLAIPTKVLGTTSTCWMPVSGDEDKFSDEERATILASSTLSAHHLESNFILGIRADIDIASL